MIFAMASLGLPGLGNFIAEFLILTGTFKASILFTCLASTGLVAATIYALRIVQKVFLGKENIHWEIQDLSVREKLISAFMVILIIYLGLFPQKIIDTADGSIHKTLNPVEQILPGNSNLIKSTP
jgi:NADH-quinone oxidoreductase subunit M